MYITDVLRISLSNATRGRIRAILTALSIAIGVSSVMLISSLGDSGKKAINKELDKLGINGITVYSKEKSVGKSLKIDDVYKIKQNIPEVSSAQPLVIEYGGYRLKNDQGNMVLWGIDSDIEKILDIRLLYGRMPNTSDVKFAKNVVVVDQGLAQSNYSRDNIVGKSIILNTTGAYERFQIIGVIQSQKDGINQMFGGAIPDFSYIPYTTLNRLRSSSSISQIAIKCAKDVSADETGAKAVSLLERINDNPEGYSSENMTGHVEKLKSIAGLVALLISAIAAISLCVAGLGIMNTMLSSTSERKKEIGICMAIGAKRKDIAICFLAESALISAIGGSIGALVGIGISFFITSVFKMPASFSFSKFMIAESVSILSGIIFAVIPALRAANLDPIIALRDE